MKKFSILFACLVAAFGFVACEDDKDPVYQDPTEFVLNTPATANMYHELYEGGTITFTCSQPNYGYSAIATYGVEVSLTEDFAEVQVLEPTTPTSATLVLEMKRFAQAINALRGISTISEYTDADPMSVYVRATAMISGIEGSEITSNWVKINNVKTYATVREPGIIYLIGNVHGSNAWVSPDESNAASLEPWTLKENADEIDSKIYHGTFYIPEPVGDDGLIFRFYTKLTGWETDSYGTQVDDNPIEIELSDNAFSGSIMKGKGSYKIMGWTGGTLEMTVDLKDMKVYYKQID